MINTVNKARNKKYIKVAIVAVAALVILSAAVFIIPAINPDAGIPSWSELFKNAGLRENSDKANAELSVHFIDVGQGDCIFIKTENGNALIDSGDIGNSDKIIRYLRNFNADKLDYVFITHPDSDHIGSMPEVIQSLEVTNIIMPDIESQYLPTTKIFEKLLNSISTKHINTSTAKVQDTFRLGAVTITVVGPITRDSEMKNISLVLLVVHGDNSFLLTGDAEIEEENEIISSGINIEADVLKAGHHGSKSSSGLKFLRMVKPKSVIISCGRDNSFGHPSIETLDRFSQLDAEILRTDFLGTITVTSDGTQLKYYFEKEIR